MKAKTQDQILSQDQILFGKHARRTRKGGDPAALHADVGLHFTIRKGELLPRDDYSNSPAWNWLHYYGSQVARAILNGDAGFFLALAESTSQKRSTAPTARLNERGEIKVNLGPLLRSHLLAISELAAAAKADPLWFDKLESVRVVAGGRSHRSLLKMLPSMMDESGRFHPTVNQLDDALRAAVGKRSRLRRQNGGLIFDLKTIRIAAKQVGIRVKAERRGRPPKEKAS